MRQKKDAKGKNVTKFPWDAGKVKIYIRDVYTRVWSPYEVLEDQEYFFFNIKKNTLLVDDFLLLFFPNFWNVLNKT